MRKFSSALLLSLLALLFLAGSLPAFSLLVIDPGHGGTDSGAVATLDGVRILEKDLNLAVSRRLIEKLTLYGFDSTMTRSGDVTVSLSQRVSFSNSLPTDYFISIHHNSFTNPGVSGVEVYYYRDSQAGKALATLVARYISEITGLKNRGAKETTSLYVVANTKATAILVECGFMSNPEELKKLADPKFQNLIAEAIFRAIRDFISTRFVESGCFSRIYGETRIETAALLSSRFFTTAQAVVVANGFSFADSLAAASLCGHLNCPLLFVRESSVPSATIEEIKRLGASKVFVVGGPAVVAGNVETVLKSATGCEVERIHGRDRFETAEKIAMKVAESGVPSGVFVVNGFSEADSLSCANLSALSRRPILFSRQDTVPYWTSRALAELRKANPSLEVIAVGGPGVISDAVVDSLSATRIAGADRFETNLEVQRFGLERGLLKTETLFFVNGNNPVDALSVSGASRSLAPVVVLVRDSSVPLKTFSFLSRLAPPSKSFIAAGGPSVIKDECVRMISVIWVNQ